MDRTFPAYLVSVADGDTITVDVDLGFGLSLRQRVRVRGMETWERTGAERMQGDEVQRRVCEWLGRSGVKVWIVGDRFDKYGRFLADVKNEEGRDLGTWLKGRGLAWDRSGHGRRPTRPSGG